MNDDKICIIDPLTTLCKLALLYFMPDNTKLSISNHVLHIQEYSYMQGAKRMINGDNRRDISNLNTPLLKVIKWYILDNDEKTIFADSKVGESIRAITFYAIQGLRKSQNITYNSDMSLKIILQYFINILTCALDGKWDETHVAKTQSEGSILTDTIKNNYDSKVMNSIAKMLTDADQSMNSPSDVSIMIDCVHRLLRNRDNQFVNMMKELNTVL